MRVKSGGRCVIFDFKVYAVALEYTEIEVGIQHTSDLSRKRAREVFAIVGLLDRLDAEAQRHLASLSLEVRRRLMDRDRTGEGTSK